MTVGDVVDCEECGLRYSRQVMPASEHQSGEHCCSCGHVL